MGYTHYWRQPQPFTDTAWESFTNEVRNVFASTKVPLANGLGARDTDPNIAKNFVRFNGVEDDGHETCTVNRCAVDFDFCKTAHKPYDSVVVQVLKLARKHNPSIELSSDGGPNVFDGN